MTSTGSTSNARKKKLAILCTHPVQYFSPLFRELESSTDVESEVFFGCLHGAQDKSYDPDFDLNINWDCNVLSGYKWRTASRMSLSLLSHVSSIGLALKTCLKIIKIKPDYVLIFAYSPFYISACSIILILANTKILLRADTSDTALTRSRPKNMVRDLILGFYYKCVYHFFPIGCDSYDHYIRLGVNPNKLSTALYAIDKKIIKPKETPTNETSIACKNDKSLNIGFVGKFTDVKDPLIIIEALCHLSSKERQKIHVKTAGTGPLREMFKMQCQVASIKYHENGFLNQSEMYSFYQTIDLLILPSVQGEVWGLVVNEALSQGVRVIVSDNVGCRHDLVTSDSDGWVFPAGQSRMLAAKIKEAIASWPWEKNVRPTPSISELTRAVLRVVQ